MINVRQASNELLIATLCLCACGGVNGTNGDGDGEPDAGSEIGTDAATGLGPWSPPNLIAELPLQGNAFSCWLSPDATSLFFAGANEGEAALELYESNRASPSDPWGAPSKAALADLNDGGGLRQDLSPSLTDDQLTLWYARGPGIFRAARSAADLPFEPPVEVAELNNGDVDRALSVAASGTVGVFNSLRSGTQDHDLFLVERSDPAVGAPWTQISASVNLNSPDFEGGPVLSRDGLSIYFFRTTAAGQDLFTARRASADVDFNAPEPIAELNTSAPEAYPCVSADERTMVFARATDGAYDLWEASR